jgi:polysaccharide pyruvyl transferase WcaK-like protein
MTIALFDPAVASENLGDQIIQEAVLTELGKLWPREQIVHIATQDVIGRRSETIARRAHTRIVGGTNLLSSHMLRYRQWAIGLRQSARLGGVTLLGVGWWQYQGRPDPYTRALLRRALRSKHKHSVRDEYTARQLASIGIQDVINTCCPTTWSLSDAHCAGIPAVKASDVVLTLTDYHKEPEIDVRLVGLLKSQYEKVYFWPQGSGDLEYARQLGLLSQVDLIRPSLASYDAILDSENVDFVGTRLHAGIRALQRSRRALILAVDNRAVEISRDVGLAVVPRNQLEAAERWILSSAPTKLSLPWAAIAEWRGQFDTVRLQAS